MRFPARPLPSERVKGICVRELFGPRSKIPPLSLRLAVLCWGLAWLLPKLASQEVGWLC